MSDKIVYVSDDTFDDEVLQGDMPVLVDFWADWCGPCKMIAPILDEISDEYEGRLKVAKLNIDDNPNTPPTFGIRGIPTQIFFDENGKEIYRHTGFFDEDSIIAQLTKMGVPAPQSKTKG